MNHIEKLLSNDEQKMIFLKAIILGISYGQSTDAEYYKFNIENEISKLFEKINSNPGNYQKTNNVNEKVNKIIEKYENNNIVLENQKNHTISLIQGLSSNNYSFNYSKINLLKSNLAFIMKELEKNKNMISKLNNNISDEPNHLLEKNRINNNENNINKPLIRPIQVQKQVFSNKSSDKKYINQGKENLSGELEKTLNGLQNLFIN